jgi:PKD repeat protein
MTLKKLFPVNCKYACVLIGFVLFTIMIRASPIDSTTAKTVAANFYTLTYNVKNPLLLLTYTEKSSEGEAEYYIYTVSAADTSIEKGFVIISADDAAHPIIGYSSEGYFPNSSFISPDFTFWMQRYKKQIASIRLHHVKASADIASEWSAYKNNRSLKNSEKATGSVLPLVKTVWAQSPYFNSTCPDNCVAGCVATAMGQIMKYWAYPPHGIGASAYNDNPYGTLSANYDTTHYDWAAMPNNVTKSNSQVAALIYDCGISVDMEYSPGNSGSYMISGDASVSSQSAFVKQFGYNASTIQGLYMSDYSGSAWIALLKNELNNNRPFQYAGSGDSGAHSWVCDGYNVNNYFHMNWGWAGYEDGYFTLSALNPAGIPLDMDEEALIGIEPAPAVADFNANTLIIWAGDTVRFTDNSFGPVPLTDWQWAFPGAITTSSSLQNPMAIYNNPGTYDVSETAVSSKGSGSTTQRDFILVLPNSTVNVYPTLNDGTFTVQLHDATLSGSNITFSVYDIMGQKVYTTTLVQYRTQVALTVPHGMYFFRAFDASGKPVSTGKLVMK